ncbi:serine/threonine-protein kinase ZRK1-like [Quercus suber]|uniref:serine/threonine-protein kinase ZRK1-like n=1 Tax=Quercus suber TaxID=58331 RepID=UPI000CE18B35|nr:non-functional pseudokinase ZED1-like [Quercus suber]
MRSWWIDNFFRMGKESEKSKERKEKRAFLENRSLLLEKLIATCNGKCIPIRNFSIEELMRANNNYDNCQSLGWYKGSLEGRIFFIRVFPGHEVWTRFVIHDLVISVRMSDHNNVLKPIGCCLDTRSPTLVNDFAANGTLADRIHGTGDLQGQQPLTWVSRLKIAREIAHVTSYLQTAFSRPIIHRSINIQNIFLDKQDVPKLSTFGFSLTIPEGETHVDNNAVVAYPGYAPPEYKVTRNLTEKANVYSFGMLLPKLLTGQHSYDKIRLRNDKYICLVAYMHNNAKVIAQMRLWILQCW